MEFHDEAAAKSFDFGDEGYTASLTDWHELLQLTAPSPHCGIAYVRGDFPHTPDAILARVQNRGQPGSKGTFGIQLLQDSGSDSEPEFQLVGVVAYGLINYRWPHIQYKLSCKAFENGYYETCSFVHDSVVYQVARLKTGETRSSSESTDPNPQTPHGRRVAKFKVGGRICFGC